MTQDLPITLQSGTGLVDLLRPLLPSANATSATNLPRQLAKQIDFSSSIKLSQALGKLPTIAFAPGNVTSEKLSAQFLRVRATLIRSVMDSFATQAESSRFHLPAAADLNAANDNPWEPYQKFYIAHQRHFELSVHDLRAQVRQGVAGLALDLAQLAALDAMLSTTLSNHTRHCYAVIPKLLQQHFENLHQEYQQHPADFIAYFCAHMKSLLLAEIDDRLLPVLGFIEAINHRSTET